MQGINKYIKVMRMERCRDSPRGIVHKGSSGFSHYGCENSATPSYLQHGTMPTFLARGKEEGDTPKEETLGDYLQEYESQSRRFKEHLNFQRFCQLKEDRRPNNQNRRRGRMQHTLGGFFLPTFDGSPKSTVKAWVKKLDTYFQLIKFQKRKPLE